MSLEGRGFEVSKPRPGPASLLCCFFPLSSPLPLLVNQGVALSFCLSAMLATIFPAMTIYADLPKLIKPQTRSFINFCGHGVSRQS